MASKLSSLLVKQGIIPIKKIDSAFKKQIIFGGTLDTALLDMGLITELELIEYLVEITETDTIQPSDIIIENPNELTDGFPLKIAKQYNVIPVKKMGDSMGVLVNAEFNKSKINELGFLFGTTLIPRVVPEIRLMEAASKVYGFELDSRFENIIKKMGETPVYPSNICKKFDFLPSPPEVEQVIEEKEEEQIINDEIDDENLEETPVPSFEYNEHPMSPDVLIPALSITEQAPKKTNIQDEITNPGIKYDSIEKVKELAISEPEAKSEPESEPELEHVSEPESESASESASEPESEPESEPVSEPVSEPDSNAIEKLESKISLPSFAEKGEVDENEDSGDSKSIDPASKVTIKIDRDTQFDDSIVSFDGSPLTFEQFSSELEQASDKDEILIKYLRFSSNFFEFGYIFTISGKAAQGRFGLFNSQIDQHNVRNYLVALDFPSVLQTAYHKTPLMGDRTDSEGDLFILDYLSLGRPQYLMSIPIILGKRVVAILYGTTNKGISSESFEHLVNGASLVAESLLSLIKSRKIKITQESKAIKADIPSSPDIGLAVRKKQAESKFKQAFSNVINNLPGRDAANTVPIKTLENKDSSNHLEEIISLFDRLEHISYQQNKLDEFSYNELIKHKEDALEVLSFYFPGTVTYQNSSNDTNLIPPSQYSPILEFVINWGLSTVPVLMKLLDHESPKIRYFAVYVFHEMRLPEMLYRITEKLFDSSPSVREISGKVLLSYEGHKELKEISNNLKGFLNDSDPFIRECSILAIGEMRDKSSITELIELLKTATPSIGKSIISTLEKITLRNFDTNINRWSSWWAVNQKRHRILWLIETLRETNSSLRIEAFKELKRIVGKNLGYNPLGSLKEREASVHRWINWWEDYGKRTYLD